MKALKSRPAFLLLFLLLCVINCSRDGDADQDPDDEITEICLPQLITPADSAELDNGCYDGSDPVVWLFDWQDCENSHYNIVIWEAGNTIPLIDEWLDESEYLYRNPSAYIAEDKRSGWTWKVRALVDGKEGAWSEESRFSVEPADRDCESDQDLFTDPRDGNVYKTVRIGDQVWMAENLRAEVYPDGRPIPLIEDAAQWEGLSGSGAYCWYANDIENKYTWGALYNFYAVLNGEPGSGQNPGSEQNPGDIQGVCPAGWHLPGDEEWKELEMYLGMSQNEADNLGWRGTNQGSKIAGRIDLWTGSGELTENAEFRTTNFSAAPAGHRNPDYSISDFADLGSGTGWWSATDSYAREIQLLNSSIYRNIFDRRYGLSVRCIRD